MHLNRITQPYITKLYLFKMGMIELVIVFWRYIMPNRPNENQFYENNQRLRCPNCGEPVKDGEKYCGNCGTILVKECYKCGKDIPIGKQYCPSCGTDNSEQAIKSFKEKEESNKELEKIKNRKILIAIAYAILAIIVITLIVKYSNKCKELAYQNVFVTQFLYDNEREYAPLDKNYKGKYHSGYLAIKKNSDKTVSYFIIIDNQLVIPDEKYNLLLVSYCQEILNNRRWFDEKVEELFVYINNGYFNLMKYGRIYGAKDLDFLKKWEDEASKKNALYTESYRQRILPVSYLTDSNLELFPNGDID